MPALNNPVEAPEGVKTNRQVLKTIVVPIQGTTESQEPRYYDFAFNDSRTEYVKRISWALRNNRTIISVPVYIE